MIKIIKILQRKKSKVREGRGGCIEGESVKKGEKDKKRRRRRSDKGKENKETWKGMD